MAQSRLTIVPCSVSRAKQFVDRLHRHHIAPQSALFACAVSDKEGVVRGVAIVGRPVARMLEDGFTCEVVRLCTDGAENACSALYAACWRAAKDLGFRRIVTYILASEDGTSLRASGWVKTADSGGGSWSRPSRLRDDKHPTCAKTRWEANVENATALPELKWGDDAITGQLDLWEVPAVGE